MASLFDLLLRPLSPLFRLIGLYPWIAIAATLALAGAAYLLRLPAWCVAFVSIGGLMMIRLDEVSRRRLAVHTGE